MTFGHPEVLIEASLVHHEGPQDEVHLKDSTEILSHASVVINEAVIFRTEAAVVAEGAHSRAGVVVDEGSGMNGSGD